MSHFDLLGLPRAFALDLAQLDARYRALSQQWHPDKFAGGTAAERIKALAMTTAVNDAYKTLRDPLLRSGYLLKLGGLDLDQEGAGAHQMAPDFLMEILELREALDEAKRAKDVPRALEMGKQVAAREQAAYAVLERLFAVAPQPLAELADQVAALRYFRRFQDEVSVIEEESMS